MIKHLVLFKFKKDAPLEKFKERIEDLKNHIPEIIHIEAGIDIKFDSSSSDFAVFTQVKNLEDLKIYATHPKHLEVIEFLKPFVIGRKVVDYEV